MTNDEKLDEIHRFIFIGDGASPSMVTRLDRLEQAEKKRAQSEANQRKVIWTAISAAVTSAIAAVVTFIGGRG